MKILVTGGAGFIGSHSVVELVNLGYDVVVFDNFTNSDESVIESIGTITNQKIDYVSGDIRDEKALVSVFAAHDFSAVIHFAGLKSVSESVSSPLSYYENNVYGTLQVLKVMMKYEVKQIVFSSSASVYGEPASLPLREDMSQGKPTNPYGMSKLIIENILADVSAADPEWGILNLRYFNPVGSHKSGLIGESPVGTPNNLMPFINQAALGQREKIFVFGNDYDTPDGTGIRDYIHVVDLARGHTKALEKCQKKLGFKTINLGTGRGYSVLEVIREYENATGCRVPFEYASRRAGDVACCYADPSLAREFLQWHCQLSLSDMCLDSWRWACNSSIN